MQKGMANMKKINGRKRAAIFTALLLILQLMFPLGSCTAKTADSGTALVFSDSGIRAASGDGTGYTIDGTSLTITEAGSYTVSGSSADGSIRIKKGTTGVTLILAGLSLTAADTAPITVGKSASVTIEVKAGTVNSLADTAQNNDDNYPDNENAENAVIKCKDGSNVVLCGTGALTITANGKNGIKSGATTESEGTASLTIRETALTISAPVNDAINAEATLTVESGTLTIAAGDDAIHSDYTLTVGAADTAGPTIRVTSCYEGLEGANLTILSGDIEIHSTDDGLNAANSDLGDYAFTLDIAGGRVYIDAENGDGIDSNGTLTISGGDVTVFSTSEGDNAPLDSDGTFSITGGSVLAVGNAGMALTPASGSQTSVAFGAGGGMPGGNMQGNPPAKPGDSSDSTQGNPPAKPGDSSDGTQGNPPAKPGDSSDGTQGNPPAKPGDSSDRTQGNPPAKPGDSSDGTQGNPPAMPDGGNSGMGGQASQISIAAGDTIAVTDADGNVLATTTAVRAANYVFYASATLTEGETYTLTVNGTAAATQTAGAAQSGMPGAPGGNGTQGNPPAMPGGNAPGGSAQISYSAAESYSTDTAVKGERIAATDADENAVLVTGGNVLLDDTTLTSTSTASSGGDNASFYGVGAAALVTAGRLFVRGGSISTTSKGGAGVFAYGEGTAYVADTGITTTADTAGGIHAAGGGTLYAWDLNVTTSGGSSAAIRSDRGGGTMVVDGGSYVSNGSGSPAVYSTADIAVQGATLTANGSEAVCIEGLNSLSLYDCDLSGNMQDDAQNDNTWTVIVYQSMSGDSEIGCGKFSMVGGSLTSGNGGVFYTTNTESAFYLENVNITAAADAEYFLRVTGNANKRGWGTAGSNGADCTFTAVAQRMDGNVVWDASRTLDFYMQDGSTLIGAFVKDETYSGSGYAKLYISADSTWVVTADSTLDALYAAGTVIGADGKRVTIVTADGKTLAAGDSAYTVTVTDYAASADFSGAGSVAAWSTYAAEKPTALTTGTLSDSTV